jgi:hypothetical protein
MLAARERRPPEAQSAGAPAIRTEFGLPKRSLLGRRGNRGQAINHLEPRKRLEKKKLIGTGREFARSDNLLMRNAAALVAAIFQTLAVLSLSGWSRRQIYSVLSVSSVILTRSGCR